MKYLLIAALLILATMESCKKSDNTEPQDYQLGEGVFIVNQGTFTAVNSSLAFYETQKRLLTKGLFKGANDSPMGDVAQSITMSQGKAWIVVNNSGVIHAINSNNAKLMGTIAGLTSPRYMLMINENKAYVSDLFSKTLHIVDPSSYTITGEIPSDNRSTEEMVLVGNHAFVANW